MVCTLLYGNQILAWRASGAFNVCSPQREMTSLLSKLGNQAGRITNTGVREEWIDFRPLINRSYSKAN